MYIDKLRLKFKIDNLSYLPRWVIVIIDVSVLLLAFVFTYLLFKGTGLNYIKTNFEAIFFI